MMIMNEKDMRIERAYLKENCPEIFENKNGIEPSYSQYEISVLCRIYHIYNTGIVPSIVEKAEQLIQTIKDISFMNMTDMRNLIHCIDANEKIELGYSLMRWISENVQTIENFLCTLITSDEDENMNVEDILECLNILDNVPNEIIKSKYMELLKEIGSLKIDNMLWDSFNLIHEDEIMWVDKTMTQMMTTDEIIDIVSIVRESKMILLNRYLVFILKRLPYNKTVKNIIWKGRYDGSIGDGLIAYLEHDLLADYYDIRLTKAEIAEIVDIYSNIHFEMKNNLIEELRYLKFTISYIEKLWDNGEVTINICDELYEIQNLMHENYNFDIFNMTSEDVYEVICACYENHKLSYIDKIFK